jgi:ubiquinone/menaquinone biosynthesis C-methylase UbiE
MDDPKSRAQSTYNAAADTFDAPALGFWDRFGRATVQRLDLPAGARVLDACAGSGASAIPAALRVGPTGQVVAVDLAERLLELAQLKATRLGLGNVQIRHGDIEALDYPPGWFDAVVIVFGIFFLPDMDAAARRLWEWVRPGGQLAVTTWGPRWCEPASSVFWQAVADVRPELHRAYNPWEGLTDPAAVTALLTRAGAIAVRVETDVAVHPLRRPEDFWTIVLGSGYRATHDAMTPTEQATVRAATVAALEDRHVTAIETNVIFATATKPASP